jgi:hypothetical protein
MSTSNSVGRSASKSKKDRSPNLCTFTFADGRQCRTPRCSGHLHFCYFHAQKEAQSLAAQQVGQDISRFLPTKLLTACDLGAAMSRLFCAVAQGQIKPKVASTLAYLAQTMLQSIPIAQHEYIESFDTDTWRNAVRFSFRYEDEASTSAPQPVPAPAPPTPVDAGRNSSRPGWEPGSSSTFSSTSPTAPQPPVNCHSACPDPVGERSDERPTSGASPESYREDPAASSSNSSLATHRSPLPQHPHTPLSRTSAEFAQQLLAGRNSSRSETPTPAGSEIPTLPEPSRETNSPGPSSSSDSSSSASSSISSSSTQPTPAPHPTSPQQSQPTQNSQHNSQPTPTPPARTPVPPSFGAPANWDALIPPKPRRRFSRHGHLLD